MPQFQVDSLSAVPLRRQKGIQVTIVNQAVADVFMDKEPNRLNTTPPGVPPSGTRIAGGGGQVQIQPYPGEMWFRAANPTTIEVQP